MARRKESIWKTLENTYLFVYDCTVLVTAPLFRCIFCIRLFNIRCEERRIMSCRSCKPDRMKIISEMSLIRQAWFVDTHLLVLLNQSSCVAAWWAFFFFNSIPQVMDFCQEILFSDQMCLVTGSLCYARARACALITCNPPDPAFPLFRSRFLFSNFLLLSFCFASPLSDPKGKAEGFFSEVCPLIWA